VSSVFSAILTRVRLFHASKLGKISVSVGLKVFGAVIAFIWQLFTIRILGPLAGGLVAVAQSQMRLIGTTGALGQDRSLSLSLPTAGSQDAIRQRLKRAQTSGLVTTSIIMAGALIFMVAIRSGWQSAPTLLLTGMGAITFCLLVGAAGAARGLQSPLAADLGFTILPLSISSVMFASIGAWYGWTAGLALVSLVTGQAVALIYLRLVLLRSLRDFKADAANQVSTDDTRSATARNIDQLAIAVCTTFSAMYPDALLIIVGYASSSVSAAAFGIAVRYIRLARFVPVSFLHVREPALAKMWSNGQAQQLAREVQVIAASSFLVSVGILLPLMLFASTFLGIFGPTFTKFTVILRLVVLAELINSLALMPTSMLLIGRHFRTLAAINLGVYFTGLLIAGFAINTFGGEGAAIALVGTNVLLAFITSTYCFRLVKVRSDAITSCATLVINKFHKVS
jgi:O-antigen/teichoic acid export membrane protein